MSASIFKLGSDPELMLKRGNRLVSAIPIISGTKNKPIRLTDGMAQHDNVNAELGITPADTEDQWVDRHRSVLIELDKLVGSDVRLSCTASADFPVEELDCEEAKRFACDPDFDAYTCSVNEIDDDAGDGTLRTCGGHVHIGNKEISDDLDKQIACVKAMDVFLGLPSILLDKDPTSLRRRNLYGKAGAHRPKPYGVEFRAIGNFWLSHPTLTRLVWKLVRDGLAALDNKHLDAINERAVVTTINRGLVDKAEMAMKGIVIPLIKEDTRKLFVEALEMEHSCIYSGWGL